VTNFFALLISTLFLFSCATYQSRIAPARQLLSQGDCGAALNIFKDFAQKEDGDQLVHLMEYGSALQICGDYAARNKVFLKADKLSEQLDYHSLSRVAGATLLNEEMIQYKGDTFEKLFINISAALNYIQLNQLDEAMVEVRRINEKFRKFNSDEKKKFELNSFSQYLSGLIYEIDQKYDDACISYKASYKLDSTYRGVAIDMLHACWLAKRSMDFEILAKEIRPNADEMKLIKNKNKNETILIFMQGWGPRKEQRPENRNFPHLVPVTSVTQTLQVEIDSVKYRSQPVYSVEKAAIETLNADYNALVARRLGSFVAKEVVADQIRQKDRALGQIALLVMLASEKADLRQWSLLPQSIQVIRLGSHDPNAKLKLTGLDRNNNVSENFEDIKLGSGGGTQARSLFMVRSLK
jgi:uncharacterized protein